MHLSRIGLRRARLAAVFATLAVLVALLVNPGQAATAEPPPNPSDSQIQKTKAQKAALASEVGRLSGEVASITQQLHQLEADQELAEQKLAHAVWELREARAEAKTARAKVHEAQARVDAAQQEFVAYLQASYMSSPVDGATGALLTADNPSVLLEQGALRRYQSQHQISAIGELQRATVAKANADAAARRAVQRQQKAKSAAKVAKRNADAAVTSAQQQKAQLQQRQAQTQRQLEQKKEQLASQYHQRAVYKAWKKEQERIAREKARQERLRRERARQAAQARERAERQNSASHHSSSGGGGGGHSGGGGGSAHSATSSSPSGGGWSPARGRRAVERAEHLLGVPYSWAGGNFDGPTYGVCVSGGAWNDCNIVGVDCSGLTLYAWAPYIHLDHYTVTQYGQAGSYHPSRSELRPGDLVFWSSNGSRSGIHHVAIYTGNGMVIQAPFSGSYVQRTPLDQVSSGYYGATRPLT